jgi:hypothetical protein
VKIEGVSENNLTNIIYKIRVFQELQKLKKSQEALSSSM